MSRLDSRPTLHARALSPLPPTWRRPSAERARRSRGIRPKWRANAFFGVPGLGALLRPFLSPRLKAWRTSSDGGETGARREQRFAWSQLRVDAQGPEHGERHIWTGFAMSALAALIVAEPLRDPSLAVPSGCFVLALASLVELLFVLHSRASGWINVVWALSAAVGGVILLVLPLSGSASPATSLSFYLVVSASVLCSIAAAQRHPRVLFAMAGVNMASAVLAIALQYEMAPWLFGVLLGLNVLSIGVAHVKLGLLQCNAPIWTDF